MKSIGLLGIGHYVPETVVTNDDFVKRGLDTSDEWIVSRTGIRERRIASATEATSDLAVFAAQAALQNARVDVSEIDLIVLATSTPDYLAFPSTAAVVQHRLGARLIPAFDVSAACSGFNYALSVAHQFCLSGAAQKALVIAADCLSKIVNWEDRSTCILFGDGAGAVVMGQVDDGFGILSTDLHANGAEGPSLMIPEGGTRVPLTPEIVAARTNKIAMNGKAVFKIAVSVVGPSVENALQRANLSIQDLDLFVPHQANYRIVDAARERLGLREDQVFMNLDKYGNTSAASIPIALSEAVSTGKLKSGMIVAVTGFGAGFTWGTNIVKWGVGN